MIEQGAVPQRYSGTASLLPWGRLLSLRSARTLTCSLERLVPLPRTRELRASLKGD
jgi:hypothetical protein